MALPAKQEHYTYADYLLWEGPERYELIDGEAVMLSAPTTVHQLISAELMRQLTNYLEGKKCLAVAAPFDVRLFEREGDRPEDVQTVVQPDISIICDRDKLDERGCKGAPDLVIEVLSPSTERHDRSVKFNLYERAGVREYWLVDPENRTIEQHLLQNGRLELHTVYVSYSEEELNRMTEQERAAVETHFKCSLYDDFDIALDEIFSGLLP